MRGAFHWTDKAGIVSIESVAVSGMRRGPLYEVPSPTGFGSYVFRFVAVR